MERHGVLVVGPNPASLNHISRVLPSLGESDVVFMTTGDLVPGLHVTAEDSPVAARLKGSCAILDVLAAAVADRQRLPEHPLPVDLADLTVRIDAETCEWAREEARASGLPHNEARAVFSEVVTWEPETLLAPLYTSPDRLRAAGAGPVLLRADGAVRARPLRVPVAVGELPHPAEIMIVAAALTCHNPIIDYAAAAVGGANQAVTSGPSRLHRPPR